MLLSQEANGMEDSFEVNFCKVLVKKLTLDSPGFERYEEPLIDVIDEEDHVRLLVQCHCQEEQVSIHVNKNHDGITVCKERCHLNKESDTVVCGDVCSTNIPLNLKDLQLENNLFIISQCNNNNVLEITIPKIKLRSTTDAK